MGLSWFWDVGAVVCLFLYQGIDFLYSLHGTSRAYLRMQLLYWSNALLHLDKLSICFALLFSFGNFVNWWLSSDWMGFGYTMNNAIHNYCNVLHFVRNFVDFRTFTWTTSFASSVFWWNCFFVLLSPLKSLSLLNEEIWNFTAVICDNEFVIKVSYTEVLFQ